MKLKNSKSLSRMGFEKNDKGQIVRKAGAKVKRKNYNPKAKLTGHPKSIVVNSLTPIVDDTGIKIMIKPISVNDAWQGRKFRTPYYDQYEEQMLIALPNYELPAPPYRLMVWAAFSQTLSDLDNIFKPFFDILQKKYSFNDKDIFEIRAVKKIVSKKEEFIKFKIETFISDSENIF